MTTLKTSIEKLPHIGPRYVLCLKKLGIKTAGDLIFHFPFRYDDFSDFRNISDVGVGEVVSVKGEIVEIRNVRTRRRRMTLTEAVVEDDSGAIQVIWFNQPFITNNLKAGMSVSLSGKVAFAKEGLQLSSPAYEVLGKSGLHTGRLVPVYHETEGVSSKWLRAHIKPLMWLTDSIEEFLPAEVLEKQDLLDMHEAIRQIHFPEDTTGAKLAKRRLAFDELFLVQLYMQRQRQKWQGQKAVEIKYSKGLEAEIKYFLEKLPFKLTDGQKIAIWKIIKDMEKDSPMNRLLEGDVGSGKTLVALLAVLAVVRSGYQALIMAPTEILARQHFAESIKRFSGTNIRIALLTGSESRFFDGREENDLTKEKILSIIKKGEVDLVIGTHALIQEKVSFKNLALSVVDEQHRFGIEQRAQTQNEIADVEDVLKMTVPHLLSMTATPIPRTLALTVYGDLDLSVLNEMPKGRQKIITKLVASGNRDNTYDFIRDEIKSGRQVFVICPLIEESDILEVKSATEEFERLSKEIYPDFQIGLLHGKMKPKEKEDMMKKFAENRINILVSTSVVEVGIDIPNATVMLIEGADRFGLAQLHQFRGRVGRGEYQSYCFLFTDSTSSKTHRRLKALIESDNGFDLAQKDLELRGPGELVGVRQSGLPDLAMASLSDSELIQATREEAQIVLEKDPDLKKYPKLLKKIESFEKDVHLE
ncbi:MAG: ATP-dependent DNA helicase RecG [Candidatus Pacebacteria bacterium]|nr:ATP-dependent DNA helicase RecG [Candidatus Paceibacterota bacterium]